MSTSDLDNPRFDQAMRSLHAEALAKVSPATMAQLHRRRHAALSPRPARLFGWPLAAATASLLAVAIGVGVTLDNREPARATAPMLASTQAPDAAEDELDAALDGLDESPDFYVWLASGDAALLAME